MNGYVGILVWVVVLAILSVAGRFADYLLNTELRQKEKVKVQEFFRDSSQKLFRIINKANFAGIQQLMVACVLALKNKIFGRGFLTLRYLLVSLLVSQYLTVAALSLAHLRDRQQFVVYDYTNLIPLLPFTGFSFVFRQFMTVTTFLEYVGLYWNNYLFDFLAMTSTFALLKVVNDRKKYFGLIAFIDICLSYILAYLCVWVYFATPPHGRVMPIKLTGFISELWSNQLGVFNPAMMLFYSLTTFVPIALYMSILFFLSVLKILQWISATILSDFSEDHEKTPFFKVGVAFGITAFVLTKVLLLLSEVVTR